MIPAQKRSMAREPTYEGLGRRIKKLEQEVRKRKQTEEELREIKERYQEISASIPGVFYQFLLKKDGSYSAPYMSESASSILDISAQEIIVNAYALFDRILEEDLDSVNHSIAESAQTMKTWLQEFRIRTKAGDIKWIRGTSTPHVLANGEILWNGVLLDISDRVRAEGALQRALNELEDRVEERTVELAKANEELKLEIEERKQAEKALRESEKKYRNILKNIEEGYYEVDMAGNLTFFNDALCKIRGCSRDKLMGMNNRQFMSPEVAKKVYEAFNKVYTTGRPAKGLEWETVKPDGTICYEETSTYLIKDLEGQPVGFRGIVRDVTDRKQAEKEKKKLEAQLQQALKMEAIGTLAGGIAHNFNNLLMSIIGNASMVLLDLDHDHPHYKNLKSIEKQVKSGSNLTMQLLGYAREGRYEIKPISLNLLVKETSDTFGEARKDITIHREFTEKLYGIEADQEQVEQVLLNLYVNAADAMPGGGDLFLKTMNVTNKDMAGKAYEPKPGNYVLLTIRDTGVGMDKKTIDRIFDPFFTTKGLAQGTGLGLASAYGIVKGHGGYIDVFSDKEKGTTFEIYLPATARDLEEERELPGELVEGQETVILVDDEETVLEASQQMLRSLGYDVLMASSGQEALELYDKCPDKIDMVLLDMVMPDMGGGETYDRMKEIDPKVKVLLSSGYGVDGEATEILERGCDGFIQKPFDLEQLSRSIRDILD
jgi:PAS domain S-box-containing protein